MTINRTPLCLQINLFLRVVRRREDGYHDLASLFHVRAHHCAPLNSKLLMLVWPSQEALS